MAVTAPSPLAPDNCHKVQFSCQLRDYVRLLLLKGPLLSRLTVMKLWGIVCDGYADW